GRLGTGPPSDFQGAVRHPVVSDKSGRSDRGAPWGVPSRPRRTSGIRKPDIFQVEPNRMSIKVDPRPLPSLPRPETQSEGVSRNTLAGQQAGPQLVNPEQAEALKRATELGGTQAPRARVSDSFSAEARVVGPAAEAARAAAPSTARAS